MKVEIRPRAVLEKLLYFTFALLILNLAGIVVRFGFNHDYVYGLIPLFDFNTENNIPTLYSSITLLFSSALLLMIALIHKTNRSTYIDWLGLALVFLFLSIDEFAVLHERLESIVRESLNTSGLLYFAWYIPYGIALLIFVMIYLKFLLKLPRNIMTLFVASGSIFVLGAVGIESISGMHYEMYGGQDYIYSLLYTCEEFMEMLGIAIFIYALLTYIVTQLEPLTISVKQDVGTEKHTFAFKVRTSNVGNIHHH